MRRILLGLALSFASACGGDSTGPDLSFAGEYSLQSVNGGRLPYVAIQQGTTSISIVSDKLTIADGGTWSESTTLSTTQNGQTTTQVGGDNGTWLRSGNGLALHSTKNNKQAYSGSFSSGRLDLSSSGILFVFTK